MDIESSDQKMNFTTTTEFLQEDYFKELYSDTVLKRVTLIVFFFGCIFGLIAEFGIIWHEKNGNHRYRTVLNQMVSTGAWLIISYIFLVYIPDGVRYLTGPLNATYCDVHNFLKNCIWACTIMTIDCSIILRYIFIFKWTGFAVINDDLIAKFLQLTIALVGLWMSVVKRMSVGRMPLNYFMCAGINPQGEKYKNISDFNSKKFDTTGLFVSVSYVLHILVSAKIFLYQRKMEKKMKRIKLGIINSPRSFGQPENLSRTTEHSTRSSNLSKSMADLMTQSISFAFHSVFALLLFVMNRMRPTDLNDYNYRWIVYWNQLIGVAVAVTGIATTYYIRKIYPCKRVQ